MKKLGSLTAASYWRAAACLIEDLAAVCVHLEYPLRSPQQREEEPPEACGGG